MSNAAAATESTATVHCFERAGLGRAPFRFVGMVDQDMRYGQRILNREEYNRTGVALETKPGGTCAFCGKYILNMYRVASSCGNVFTVGCDCVYRTGDAGLVAKVKIAERKRVAARKEAKRAMVVASLPGAIFAARRTLRAMPHPTKSMAARGETMLGYCLWMARNAGLTGRAKVLAIVSKAVAA